MIWSVHNGQSMKFDELVDERRAPNSKPNIPNHVSLQGMSQANNTGCCAVDQWELDPGGTCTRGLDRGVF